jgi:hypothetical protein
MIGSSRKHGRRCLRGPPMLLMGWPMLTPDADLTALRNTIAAEIDAAKRDYPPTQHTALDCIAATLDTIN